MPEQSAAWRRQREQAFVTQAPPSLGAPLERAARDHGNDTAIDLFGRGTRLGFAEWDGKSSRLASGLRGLGVERGMHVGVLLENVVEFPLTWLALARMGAVMVPINPRYSPTELNYVITDAQIGHLVIGAVSVEKIDEVRQLWPQMALDTVMVVGDVELSGDYTGWNSILECGSPDFVLSHRVEQSDLVSIQYTSGTTGFLKGCMQSHRFWLVCGFN